MRRIEMNQLFKRSLLVGGLLLVSVATSGCNIFERYERNPAPTVIPVPAKTVPDHLNQGEPAPYP
ncbi:hypothetical protein Pan153_53270 [Gimesia panareensis]|uniref:Lipoprotein n=1 Tax=Gimesia panareensis TaxID=2527978 RepID=A0A518FWF6_9PLAN|nr:hypothetical protein [Gimesia panareensis]QDV20651.1 hypothetical protein Pan153_53270 [Gimesia panareensis]